MQKICPNCLRLTETGEEQCPLCRVPLMDVESWKQQRRITDEQGFLLRQPQRNNEIARQTGEDTAPDHGDLAGNQSADLSDASSIPEAVIVDERRFTQKKTAPKMDMTKFVLGIFLSSLAFFIAFLAAYIMTNLDLV